MLINALLNYPGGKMGDVLVVHFTLCGTPCLGMNGGLEANHSMAFSIQIMAENQTETGRYRNAIVENSGQGEFVKIRPSGASIAGAFARGTSC